MVVYTEGSINSDIKPCLILEPIVCVKNIPQVYYTMADTDKDLYYKILKHNLLDYLSSKIIDHIKEDKGRLIIRIWIEEENNDNS